MIQSYAMAARDTVLHLFQFHYGTIQSVNDSLGALYLPVFQFHYGTIQSFCQAS